MVDQWVIETVTVFCTILFLEIFDRTNITVISLSSRSTAKAVWAGAALAFTLSTIVAVLLGQIVLSVFLQYILYIRVIGGAGIIAFGVWTFLKSKEPEKESPTMSSERASFVQALLLILALETGDDTQLLTILFVSWVGNAILVLVAALSGLLVAMTLGVKSGQFLKGRVSTRNLERASSVIITMVGVVTILTAFVL